MTEYTEYKPLCRATRPRRNRRSPKPQCSPAFSVQQHTLTHLQTLVLVLWNRNLHQEQSRCSMQQSPDLWSVFHRSNLKAASVSASRAGLQKKINKGYSASISNIVLTSWIFKICMIWILNLEEFWFCADWD